MSDFNPNKHAICPECGFEAVYVDVEHNTVSFVNKNWNIDPSTTIENLGVPPENGSCVICNSELCNWVLTDRKEPSL